MVRNRTVILFALLVCLGFLASGCATSKGAYNPVLAPKGEEQMAKYCNLNVQVECKEGINLSGLDKERIRNLIVKNIETECPRAV